jgi:hypothetical protein
MRSPSVGSRTREKAVRLQEELRIHPLRGYPNIWRAKNMRGEGNTLSKNVGSAIESQFIIYDEIL